jgi:hypothetical protein
MNAHDARKGLPLFDGALAYFPDALAAVAHVSKLGNDQHNPGEPLHWAREKSTEDRDKCVGHLLDAGTFDSDGARHSAKAAWRALAALQREIEADGGRIYEAQESAPTAALVAPARARGFTFTDCDCETCRALRRGQP